MRFLHRLLTGILAEARAIFGVLHLLRRPFWIIWGCTFLLTFVGLLPTRWAVCAQIFVLVGLGLSGLFSGFLAKRIRRWKWVEYPNGQEVVPFLPQLLTLMIAPHYFLAMLILFHQAGSQFPEWLPVANWVDAILLTVDNFVRTELFFDAAECFHLQFGNRAAAIPGISLVFVSRFLMNLVFIKLAVQLLNAAYFRALGLGRGEDKLFSVKQAVAANDPVTVKYLCQAVGDSLRDAVDSLRRIWETGSDKADTAWRCLVTMRAYALPYLESRYQTALGGERDRLAKLITQLAKTAEVAAAPAVQRWPLWAGGISLVLSMVGIVLLPVTAGLALAVLLTILLSWMLAGSRSWMDRLVRWQVLQPSPPDRLSRLQLRWSLCLLPLVLVCWSRLLQMLTMLLPGIFSGVEGTVNYPSCLVFVLENLLHTQIFVDSFDVYGMRITDLRQEGFWGGLLTFLLRLTLNVGMIALLVSFGMVWFNRVFRAFAVSPNAELTLRQEAHECGPQATALVGYHLREVRSFFVEQITLTEDGAMLMALSASGFFKDVQGMLADSEPRLEQRDNLAKIRMNLGNALWIQGQMEEAIVEFKAAREIQERLVREGRDDLRNDLAQSRMNLGVVLWNQGRLEEAFVEYQAAREIYERLIAEGRDEFRYDLAKTGMNLGNGLWTQGRLEEAITEYQAARVIYERLIVEGRDDLRNDLAQTRMNLGTALWTQGRLEDAIVEYKAARVIYERLIAEGRDDLRNVLAQTGMGLGNGLLTQGRLEEAVTEYQAARVIYERLVREGRDELRNDLAKTLSNLGNALSDQDLLEGAITEYKAAQEIYERLVREGRGDLRNDLAATRMNLGITLKNQGQLEEAVTEYQAVREIQERLLAEGRDDLRNDLAQTRMNLGNALRIQGRLEEAVTEYQAAREIQERLLAEGRDELRNDLAKTRCSLGNVLRLQGRFEEAIAGYQAAREIQERLVREGRDDLRKDLAWTCNAFGWLLGVCPKDEFRDGKKAIEYARQACELTSWTDCRFLDTLATAYAETGQFEEAVKWELKALEDANFEGAPGEAARQRMKLYEQGRPYREK